MAKSSWVGVGGYGQGGFVWFCDGLRFGAYGAPAYLLIAFGGNGPKSSERKWAGFAWNKVCPTVLG